MKKRFVILILTLLFAISYGTTTFAQTVTVNTPNVFKVIHKEAPSESIVPLDVGVPWTENTYMRNYTSLHFQILAAATIANGMAFKFGGAPGAWATLASDLVIAGYLLENNNVYYTVYYYYQPSYIDPQLPYYVKQFTISYAENARTTYLGSNTRYYYSNVPY